MDVQDARTIGARVRQIRNARGKSLVVVAGLAGISKSHLSRIERGERALDRRSEIIALANALQIAPSDLVKLPMPAPGNGNIDSTIEAVRRVLIAVEYGHPGGEVLPVAVLRDRIARLQQLRQSCRFGEAATDLPGLIRDLHTSLQTGREAADLLSLAVYLHVQVTSMWLLDAGAPADLRREVTTLARRLAQDHGEFSTLGVAAFATIRQLLAHGQSHLAQAELDTVALPATTPETAALVGGLMIRHAMVAAADNRPSDAAAALETAAEIADRMGETSEADPMAFAFGPTDVGLYQMAIALEAAEPDRAVGIAQGLQPARHPFATRQAAYWVDFARGLTRLRGRHDQAVRALRRAEQLHPHRVQRDPIVREVITELLSRSHQDEVGRELRRIAYRVGLPL